MTTMLYAAFFGGFAVCVILGPILIPFLLKLKVGNTEREELASHQKKTGTPTMGGLMFMAAVVVTSLFFVKDYPRIVPVLLLSAGFGIIGFLDDYLKVVKRKSDGLIAWQKMLLQIVVTAAFCWMLYVNQVDLSLRIPFTGGKLISIGWLAIPVLFFAVIGTVNGVNFTDGVDGLASTVTLPVCGFFLFASMSAGGGIEPVVLAMLGALFGFLVFNCHPAKVFMGDTGSLALGGFVAGCAYALQAPLYLLIVGFVYVAEVLSVIIQVTYFKKTGGKRIFKMAPIHHHFELGGWSETKVTSIFAIVTVLLCALGLWAY